jgi:hypothetical protein
MLVVLACVLPNLDAEVFAREEPDPQDLVGVYAPTETTRRFIMEDGGYPRCAPRLTLAADGIFTMTAMPDWWLDPAGVPGGVFYDGAGTWLVVSHQDWWDLELDFDGADLPVGATSMPLVGQAPPYRIWFYVGDPDSGDVMVFEREDG